VRRSLTITIPGKLERGLSPNGRLHWAARNRLKKQITGDTHFTIRQAIDLTDPVACFQTDPWPLTLHWTIGLTPRQKYWDDDNATAALKYHRDAIAAALGIDDRNFQTGIIKQLFDPEKRGFVRVTICVEQDALREAR